MAVEKLDAAQTVRLRRVLLAWFRRNKRDLPWRRSPEPYRVWISEIILQQTRVKQGLPYYQRFLNAFPTVEALAAAPRDLVLKVWEGLGYYARARHLHAAARIIAKAGRFPATSNEWLQLPGIGRYTANAIASIAHGEQAPVVDGNVQRVLARVFNIAESIDAHATRQRLWEIAAALVPAKAPGDFNQAMMELGARVCAPRKPLCAECPLRRQCRALAAGTHEARPVRAQKQPVPHVQCLAAVIERRGRLLLARRPDSGMLGGLWEFPTVEANDGSDERILARGLRKALGLDVQLGECAGVVKHVYSHRKVTVRVYRCECKAGVPKPGEYAEMKWVPRKDLGAYAITGVCKKIRALL